MNRKTIFKGRRIELVVDTVTLPSGATAEREVVLHPGAVVVVPVVRPPLSPEGLRRPGGGVVLLVRQHRHAVGGELCELPAGTLEPGESPDACAARELVEETGFRARRLRLLTAFWSSPGILREKMHLFLAEGLEKAEQHLDEDEQLCVEEVALDDALERVRDGRIADAKTIAGLLYYARFETSTGKTGRFPL